jgi:hypothetical protein
MASAAQIDANRLNAQASSGPTTAAGKATSAANSTQHGLAGRVIFIAGEDPAIFHELYAALTADHGPANLTEELLIYKMTEEFWFGRRAAQLLAAALDLNEKQDNAKQVALMLRYHTAADRAFHKALDQLRATQKARLTSGIGFVSLAAHNAACLAGESPATGVDCMPV